MSEQETILSDIKGAVLSVDETADVLLFGSRARGDFDEDSDWDILILTNEEVRRPLRSQFLDKLLSLEIKHQINISPVFKNRVEWIELEGTDFYSNVYEDKISL